MQTFRPKPTNAEKAKLAQVMRAMPTPAESRLWWQIRQDRLGVNFKNQVRKCGYILDFACAEKRIAVEVDGGVHRSRREYDRDRDDRLMLIGWRTLRFTNEDVFARLAWVVGRICDACGVPDKGLRKPTTKQKRRLAADIERRFSQAKALEWRRMCRAIVKSRPAFDPSPRLRKPEAADGKSGSGVTR